MIRLSESIVASRPLVLLVGPTAVGKSAIALRLARALDTDIVTADSRQIYRGMDIATDKPTREQQDLVPHRLIDLVNPNQRPDIETGATDYQGQAPLPIQPFDGLEGETTIVAGIEPLVWIDEIDEPVRHQVLLFPRGLVGGDVHSTIDLA